MEYLISLSYDGNLKDRAVLTHAEFLQDFTQAERDQMMWRFEAGIPATITRCGGAFTFTLLDAYQKVA